MQRPASCHLFITTACVLWLISLTPEAAAARLTDLRCENATNPVGVEVAQPRLSWVMAGGGGGQRAYQVLVASSREKLDAGEGDLWDSGRVISKQTTGVPYQGRTLSPGQRCYWKVRGWDAFYQPTVYSGVATWEMGSLSAKD